MIRPRRQAAIVASMKIKQYYQQTPATLSVEHFPCTNQVKISIVCIRECLNAAEKYPEKKLDTVIQLLHHLIHYPMILTVNPRFREVVGRKMDEFEVTMRPFHEFKKTLVDMERLVQYMTCEMNMKEEIISHLHAINRLHSASHIEQNKLGYDELQSSITQLRSIIKELPFHPAYVSN